MSRDNSRLLLKLEEQRRQINREALNPSLGTVDIESLLPIVKTCATARSNYISCLMSIANKNQGASVDKKQIDQLKQFRVVYEELIRAANAMETVIDRGYVNTPFDEE